MAEAVSAFFNEAGARGESVKRSHYRTGYVEQGPCRTSAGYSGAFGRQPGRIRQKTAWKEHETMKERLDVLLVYQRTGGIQREGKGHDHGGYCLCGRAAGG